MAKPGFLEHLHPPRLDERRIRFTHSFCLGGLSFFLFLVLAISGGLLMFVYTPTPQGAADFFALEAGNLPFGWFFRRIHWLAGQAMVITVMLHMVRVLITGAHLPPRASNWVVGLCLLMLTLAMDLSGYILRWDAATQSAAVVSAALMGEIPLVGDLLKRLLLGGQSLGSPALLRFYVLHCLGLPLMAFCLCLYHFWRIRRDGRPLSGL